MTTLSAPDIRPLLAGDAVAYQALRLQALAEHPTAFTSSAAEEAARPLSWSQQRLAPDAQRPHDVFLGAWQSNVLQGMVGLQGRYRVKERHNATLVGLYVSPQASHHGLGLALVQALLAAVLLGQAAGAEAAASTAEVEAEAGRRDHSHHRHHRSSAH